MQGKFSFDEDVWVDVSDLAKDLIRRLICVDPKKRLTATQALDHPWVKVQQSTKDLLGTRQNLENHLKKKFRAKVKSVMAANRMKLLTAGAAVEQDEEEEDEDDLLREQVLSRNDCISHT